MARVTRNCAGSYTVRSGDRAVDITHFSRRDGAYFDGWIARSEWDQFLLTDPVETKREAVQCAERMLLSADQVMRRRTWAAEGECLYCDEHRRRGDKHLPSHDASPLCESGKRPHCTCDTCW